MEKGLLIILSGPSGVGKGTVRKHVFSDRALNLRYSISMTTREPRPKEKDGRDYYFVTDEEFEKNIKDGNFLEWAEFVGHKYGTPKDKVEELRNAGYNVFLEIETSGAQQVIDAVGDDEGLVTIFLMPPSTEALEARIRNRKWEKEEVIQSRLAKGKKEIESASLYQHVVLNDYVQRSSWEIRHIIRTAMNEANSPKPIDSVSNK
ncbi:MAG: guanylate kinase [Coprobacillus sp.]|nr:guanylate kinase [Coprobacillus sp.]